MIAPRVNLHHTISVIMNTSYILIIIIRAYRPLCQTFCNDLVINAGQHNYFEMFSLAFIMELKKSLL